MQLHRFRAHLRWTVRSIQWHLVGPTVPRHLVRATRPDADRTRNVRRVVGPCIYSVFSPSPNGTHSQLWAVPHPRPNRNCAASSRPNRAPARPNHCAMGGNRRCGGRGLWTGTRARHGGRAERQLLERGEVRSPASSSFSVCVGRFSGVLLEVNSPVTLGFSIRMEIFRIFWFGGC